MSDPLNLPDFDDLPPVEGMPQGCAWGVFDKDGKKDVYGTLNLLTPSVVKAAAAEVKEGVSVSLNWPMNAIGTPGFGRKGLVHKVKDFMDGPNPALRAHGFDDEVEFNTQCSTQWDSLVHFNHQPTGTAYNGAKPSATTLTQKFGQEDREKKLPTLNHWHDRGGLVGRGVLVDYKAYADPHGIEYSPFSDKRITVQELEAAAKEQGTEFRNGDILIVRTGFTDALGELSDEEQQKALASHQTCGVDGRVETARWCWNKHFAAVAGDAIAFETIPPVKEDGKPAELTGLVLHQWFLSLFGMPIGELWDLKVLSAQCKKLGRYSFLLTSVPLNVPGAVGSPANAVAIF
ncbi:hypothetical protein K490DRAFT_40979 [Saccharata proteae CBS 121410]|uniref:Cyclase n=1 Tax=Saccharata proteae CBS 121410 TaxID=1314787 RepID=A0A9P4HXF2_9PEZI|nr:hypothetical protein K490DRAFT_40979 [Saccharata proteae CBS 121410]